MEEPAVARDLREGHEPRDVVRGGPVAGPDQGRPEVDVVVCGEPVVRLEPRQEPRARLRPQLAQVRCGAEPALAAQQVRWSPKSPMPTGQSWEMTMVRVGAPCWADGQCGRVPVGERWNKLASSFGPAAVDLALWPWAEQIPVPIGSARAQKRCRGTLWPGRRVAVAPGPQLDPGEPDDPEVAVPQRASHAHVVDVGSRPPAVTQLVQVAAGLVVPPNDHGRVRGPPPPGKVVGKVVELPVLWWAGQGREVGLAAKGLDVTADQHKVDGRLVAVLPLIVLECAVHVVELPMEAPLDRDAERHRGSVAAGARWG